jgi:hypothetical protein
MCTTFLWVLGGFFDLLYPQIHSPSSSVPTSETYEELKIRTVHRGGHLEG